MLALVNLEKPDIWSHFHKGPKKVWYDTAHSFICNTRHFQVPIRWLKCQRLKRQILENYPYINAWLGLDKNIMNSLQKSFKNKITVIFPVVYVIYLNILTKYELHHNVRENKSIWNFITICCHKICEQTFLFE